MQITWSIDEHDVERVREVVSRFAAHDFVVERRARNLAEPPELSRERLWQTIVGCLLTTQQRSGLGSPVNRFLHSPRFALQYPSVLAVDVGRHAREVLREAGGIRRYNEIADELAFNLRYLEAQGGWAEMTACATELVGGRSPEAERRAAALAARRLKGFGPKQSRNLWQWLGFTRWEIPLDSRMCRWLSGFGFPVRLNAATLSDAGYYDFVSDGIQRLCERAGVYPCIFDAAVFACEEARGTSPGKPAPAMAGAGQA